MPRPHSKIIKEMREREGGREGRSVCVGGERERERSFLFESGCPVKINGIR